MTYRSRPAIIKKKHHPYKTLCYIYMAAIWLWLLFSNIGERYIVLHDCGGTPPSWPLYPIKPRLVSSLLLFLKAIILVLREGHIGLSQFARPQATSCARVLLANMLDDEPPALKHATILFVKGDQSGPPECPSDVSATVDNGPVPSHLKPLRMVLSIPVWTYGRLPACKYELFQNVAKCKVLSKMTLTIRKRLWIPDMVQARSI